MGLVKGRTYIGQVIGIQPCVDNFQKTGGGISYCHKVTITLDATAEDEVVQICSDQQDISQFDINDHIKFVAKAFTKNQWTIQFTEKVVRKPATTTYNPGVQSTTTRVAHSDEWLGSNNPVMIGTAVDRAFAHASHFYQMCGNITEDRLVALAKRIHKEMLEVHSQTTIQ